MASTVQKFADTHFGGKGADTRVVYTDAAGVPLKDQNDPKARVMNFRTGKVYQTTQRVSTSWNDAVNQFAVENGMTPGQASVWLNPFVNYGYNGRALDPDMQQTLHDAGLADTDAYYDVHSGKAYLTPKQAVALAPKFGWFIGTLGKPQVMNINGQDQRVYVIPNRGQQ